MTKIWLIGGAAFLAILVIASIIVALIQTEQTLTEGSPEAAVQGFLRATESEETQIAYDFLSDDLKSECTLENFGGRRFERNRVDDSRIVFEKTEMVDNTAFVTVQVTQFYGRGPFGTSESTRSEQFSLTKEAEQWKFVRHPFPYYSCGPFPPVREIIRVAPAEKVESTPTAIATPAAP